MNVGPDMTMKHCREELLRELRAALDFAGARPSRWPDSVRARLSAFIESDDEAAKLYAEAKALDHVLAHAPEGSLKPEIEARIVAASLTLPQEQSENAPSAIVIGLEDRRPLLRSAPMPFPGSNRSFWGGAALLTASLILGIYIGASGEAVPALRGIERLASYDDDAGIAFSGSLFEPSGLHNKGQL